MMGMTDKCLTDTKRNEGTTAVFYLFPRITRHILATFANQPSTLTQSLADWKGFVIDGRNLFIEKKNALDSDRRFFFSAFGFDYISGLSSLTWSVLWKF